MFFHIRLYEVNLPNAINRYVAMMNDICDQELSHPSVQKLIKDEHEHFDLVMVEFYYPTMYAFSERFNCPMIGLTSLDAQIFGHDAVGNPTHPALYPDITLPFGYNLNLLERTVSTIFSLYIRYIGVTNIYPREDKSVQKHFGSNYSKLQDVQKKVSMLFTNVNPIFHNPRPILPSVIQIGGGTHIGTKKPLPKACSIFLDLSF